MTFKELIQQDVANVFLNTGEFAETKTVIYDGTTYEDIPVMLTDMTLEEREKTRSANEHLQGLYQAQAILYCASDSLGELQPESGARLAIQDATGFLQQYRVSTSTCESGMLCIELAAMQE